MTEWAKENMREPGNPQTPVLEHASPGDQEKCLPLGALADVMRDTAQVPYHWDIVNDVLSWGENFREILKVDNLEQISSWKAMSALVEKSSLAFYIEIISSRSDHAPGKGTSYQFDYEIFPEGLGKNKGHWIEDFGTWYAGTDGRPSHCTGMIRVVGESQKEKTRLNYLAAHDELTGSLNRVQLQKELDIALGDAAKDGTKVVYLLAAIDNLTVINQTYGFELADEVIITIGKRLADPLRRGDVIGRHAGNKFGIILKNCSAEQAAITAERLLASVKDQVICTSAGPVSASISIGGINLPADADTSRYAMACSEEALYEAKSNKGCGFFPYQKSALRESTRKHNINLAAEIISALNERRFRLAYQAVKSCATRETTFYECLLRIEQPDGQIVSAGNFMPMAEKLGLSRLIDHRVLELAMNTILEHEDITLSLNVSGSTPGDKVWLSDFAAYIRAHRNIAERLIVEITETAAIDDIEETVRFVNLIKDLGCRVAIDDFGAGYTSFRNLKLLDVDMVKIDGVFIEKMSENPDDKFFIKTLIDLARNFNLETVAEWVVSEEDIADLLEMGVDHLQGYLLAEPKLYIDKSETAPPAAISA